MCCEFRSLEIQMTYLRDQNFSDHEETENAGRCNLVPKDAAHCLTGTYESRNKNKSILQTVLFKFVVYNLTRTLNSES